MQKTTPRNEHTIETCPTTGTRYYSIKVCTTRAEMPVYVEVDECDWDIVADRRICVTRKNEGGHLYAYRADNNGTEYLHSLIRTRLPTYVNDANTPVCDHIVPQSSLNNRRNNLRAVTQKENLRNTNSRHGITAQVKGFRVKLTLNDVVLHFSRHATLDEAWAARIEAEKAAWGTSYRDTVCPDAIRFALENKRATASRRRRTAV